MQLYLDGIRGTWGAAVSYFYACGSTCGRPDAEPYYFQTGLARRATYTLGDDKSRWIGCWSISSISEERGKGGRDSQVVGKGRMLLRGLLQLCNTLARHVRSKCDTWDSRYGSSFRSITDVSNNIFTRPRHWLLRRESRERNIDVYKSAEQKAKTRRILCARISLSRYVHIRITRKIDGADTFSSHTRQDAIFPCFNSTGDRSVLGRTQKNLYRNTHVA